MVARELPSAEVLACWQHVEQRALDLRAAGMPGTLRELRVQAYLDLLQERDSRDLLAGAIPADAIPAGGGVGQGSGPNQPPSDDKPPGSGPDGSGSGSGGAAPGGGSGGSGPGGGSGGSGPGGPGAPSAGPSLAALVILTVPLATALGRSETPGEAGGFGLLDGDEARDLVAAAARHPSTRWCVTALNPDGTAAAHGCLAGRHSPPGTGPPGSPAITMTPVTRGSCGHDRAEAGYHPSRALQHLVRARSGMCTAPGCRRPAAHCDLDHTVPWGQGGLTCECDLSPLYKR